MTLNSLNSTLFKLLLGLALLLTGCRSAEISITPVETPTATVKALPTKMPINLTTAVTASRPRKIAFAPKFKFFGQTGHLSAYWQPAWVGAEQAGQNLGVNVELIASKVTGETDAEYVEPQIRLIAGLIERHEIEGLIIAPFDSNRLAPVVDKAIAAGIPTIALDTPVNSDRLLTFVVFDNFTAGQVIGEWVVRQLGGTGQALILEGPRDQQNALERRNGFLAGLRQGNIDVLNTRVADWETEPARQITLAWLQEYTNIDVILAANDNMAIGAAQAVAETQRSGIIITGFDATDQGVATIAAGQIAATIDQSPGQQARLAVRLLVRHLETGETFPPIIFLPEIPLVTKENVADYLPQK